MADAQTPVDFTNHFLIAMPGMEDAMFARSVVYVCQHNAQGALGLIINKPADLDLAGLFAKVDLPLPRQDIASQPVFHGGPLQVERGFVLHDPIVVEGLPPDESVYAATLAVPGGLDMTTSRDVLEAMSCGGGPARVLMTLGFASWDEGQLEAEIAQNHWLTVRADFDLIFNAPVDRRYDMALGLLGFPSWQLAPQSGHA